MTTLTFTKTAPPAWLLAMWKEIDDKTFGKGFDCFAEDAVCNLGVADWPAQNPRANVTRNATRINIKRAASFVSLFLDRLLLSRNRFRQLLAHLV